MAYPRPVPPPVTITPLPLKRPGLYGVRTDDGADMAGSPVCESAGLS